MGRAIVSKALRPRRLNLRYGRTQWLPFLLDDVDCENACIAGSSAGRTFPFGSSNAYVERLLWCDGADPSCSSFTP
jgi:hypothetical protein